MTESLTRREFAGLLAVGSTLVASSATGAEIAKPAPTASPLDLTLELVKQKYPHEQLVDAALEEVRSDIRHHLSRSQVLSSHPLANSDEPGFVFSAWRADRVSHSGERGASAP